jgi:Xaa-Pro aminopeptidase
MQRMKAESRIPVREMTTGWVKEARGRRIGFNASYLSVAEYEDIKKKAGRARLVDITTSLRSMRDIKTAEEVRLIRRACAEGDAILEGLIRKLSSMRTENDAALYILDQIAARGLEPAFPPIIAAGTNGANPHHVPSTNRLRGWCVIDMGVRYKGYCSDITRTVHFGIPKKKEQQTYELLSAAQQAGIREAIPGAIGGEVHEKVKKALRPLERYFIHGTGHAVGLQVHDPGTGIHAREKGRLKEGMVVTVEPGIYLREKYGMRIEDTVIITKKGAQPLTAFTKGLVIIGRKR